MRSPLARVLACSFVWFAIVAFMPAAARAQAARGRANDLLSLIDLQRHQVGGKWNVVDGKLVGVGDKGARTSRVQVPFAPKGEYEVKVVAKKVSQTRGELLIGLVAGPQQFFVSFSPTGGGISINGIMGNEFEVKREDLKYDQPTTFTCTVAQTGVYVWVGDEKFLEYRGDPKRLKLNTASKMPRGDQLFLGIGNDTSWEIESMTIGPPIGIRAATGKK